MNADASLDSVFSTHSSDEVAADLDEAEIAVGVPTVADPTASAETERLTEEPTEQLIAARSLAGALGDALASISDQLTELRNEFATKIQFDESKQRQLNMMHQELEQHRRGMITQIVRPILMDLISLYDDLTGLLEGSVDAAPQVADLLRNQIQSVRAILGKHGVEIYSSSEDSFDRSRQRVVSVVETSDESLNERVARRLRAGFTYDGRMLRPELVQTLRYRRPAD